MFYCQFCAKTSTSLRGHIQHLRVHRHLTRLLFCGLGHCKSAFRCESSLRAHVIRTHKIFVSRSSRRPFPPGVGAKFKCSVKICGKEFHHRSSLISHLKQHLATSKTIPCLVDGCLKNFSSINSLTGHVSRKHRQVNEQPIRSVSMCNLFAENSLEDVVAPEEEIPSLEEREEKSLW